MIIQCFLDNILLLKDMDLTNKEIRIHSHQLAKTMTIMILQYFIDLTLQDKAAKMVMVFAVILIPPI